MKDVSIITPVYNTAPWLPRCIESALGQTLSNIELILVDDGSTDGSRDLIQQAARHDNRVRAVCLPAHQGVSQARNAALDMAMGEFVFFLDSDDWIDPDHLERMLEPARRHHLDVLVNTRFDKVFEDGHAEQGEHFGFKGEGGEYYPSSTVQSYILQALCLRLYRLSYLNDQHIRFPLIAGGGEDLYFTGLAEVLKKQVYVIDGPCYHYFQREGSLVHSKEHAFPYIQNFKAFYDELTSRGISCDDLKMLYCGVIELDTREKFDFIRNYLVEIAPVIRKHPEYYTGHDLLLMDIVLESPDYDTFRQHHHPNIAIEYIRSKMKTRSHG